ncbi:hypothetical protein [Usitatibacter palustris]|uniref:hypothetical protein n=1 Tax=Usitatibacter palustris TaxID=2732487 RepID=UPI001488D3F3|nr:hypothetical protein [Usitatibacter palustris]
MNTIIAASAIAVGSWISVPGGAWTPDPEAMAKLQSSIRPFVVEQAALTEHKLPAWSSYTFQYQGQLRGRTKIIFVNAFCAPPPANARKQLVVVLDGGPCYFTLKYDPGQRKFFDLQFNGVA